MEAAVLDEAVAVSTLQEELARTELVLAAEATLKGELADAHRSGVAMHAAAINAQALCAQFEARAAAGARELREREVRQERGGRRPRPAPPPCSACFPGPARWASACCPESCA